MRRIELNKLPQNIIQLIFEKNPLSEDIGIYDEHGELASVIITPQAYEYFLREVEEKEDIESLRNLNSAVELKNAETIDKPLN